MLAKCGEPLVLALAMDSSLFLRKWACRRMAANGLGIILFRYADWLHEKGYRRNTVHHVHHYTQVVEHFGFWRAKHHPGSQNVQPSEVVEPTLAFAAEPFFHYWRRGPAKDLANAIKGAFLISGLLKMSSPGPQGVEPCGSSIATTSAQSPFSSSR